MGLAQLRLTESFKDYTHSVYFFYTDHLDGNVLSRAKETLENVARTKGINNYKIIPAHTHIEAFFKTRDDRDAFEDAFDNTVGKHTAKTLFGAPQFQITSNETSYKAEPK